MLAFLVLILFLSLVYLVFNKNQHQLFVVLLLLVIVVGSLMSSFRSQMMPEGFMNYAYVNYNMPCSGLKLTGKDDITANEIQTWEGRKLIHKDPQSNHTWRKPPRNLPLTDKAIISSPVGDDIELTEDPVSYSFNAIDGSKGEGKPQHLFMLAYNQCRPECCPSTFSCDRGCVCTTDQQRDFINRRGNNHQRDGNPTI